MEGKRRQLRTKRAIDSLEEDDGEAGGGFNRETLEDLKAAHKFRKRNPGTDHAALVSGRRDAEDDGQEDVDESELLDSYVKAKSIFATQENQHMEQYVEEELAKRLGKKPDTEPEDAAREKQRHLEEELYSVPAELQSTLLQPDVVVPGLMTGITEVALPAQYRLRNIEETEAAKHRLLAASRPGGTGAGDEEEQRDGVRRGALPSTFGKPKRREGGQPKEQRGRGRGKSGRRHL